MSIFNLTYTNNGCIFLLNSVNRCQDKIYTLLLLSQLKHFGGYLKMRVKQIINSGSFSYKDSKTGELKTLNKCNAIVSGDVTFIHSFVSDRVIQVGDVVSFPEGILNDCIVVDKSGRSKVQLSCEPAGLVKA